MPKGTKTARNAIGLAYNPIAITPDDIAANLNEFDFLTLGTAGDVEITPLGRDTDVPGDKEIIPAQAGYFPVPLVKVWAANTTATGIVGYRREKSIRLGIEVGGFRERPLNQPAPTLSQNDCFIPIGDSSDETVIQVYDSNQDIIYAWTAGVNNLGPNQTISFKTQNAGVPIEGRMYIYANGGTFSTFASSSYNGRQRIWLPRLADNDKKGGYIEFWYNDVAWTAGFNGQSRLEIAKNGSVYLYAASTNIGDDTKLVMRWDGVAGQAGGGAAIADTERYII